VIPDSLRHDLSDLVSPKHLCLDLSGITSHDDPPFGTNRFHPVKDLVRRMSESWALDSMIWHGVIVLPKVESSTIRQRFYMSTKPISPIAGRAWLSIDVRNREVIGDFTSFAQSLPANIISTHEFVLDVTLAHLAERVSGKCFEKPLELLDSDT
jgi:ligand-binding SRPBCC domain-containing protein